MPMITVRSVDNIRNFYVDTLGFSHVMGMVGKDGQLDFCTVVMGAARIMFMRAPSESPTPAGKQPVEIYLEVEDVDALHTCAGKVVAQSDRRTRGAFARRIREHGGRPPVEVSQVTRRGAPARPRTSVQARAAERRVPQGKNEQGDESCERAGDGC